MEDPTQGNMSAMQRVIALPELLEHVVLHLPLRQILLLERVARILRDLVQKTPRIRRALFFTSCTTEALKRYPRDHALPGRGGFLPIDWKPSADGSATRPVLNPFIGTYVCMNPLLATLRHADRSQDGFSP